MLFRNAMFFLFPLATSFEHLTAGLAECALVPVGPLELSSRGFVPVTGISETALRWSTSNDDNLVYLAVGGEDRLLPGAVVNAELAKRIAAEEAKTGAEPARIGGRARKRIKDDLITELLPRALVKPSRVLALLDLSRGLLVVDTASRKVGEGVVSEVRRALGSFPALPLNAEVAPRAVLTGWVAGEPLPEALALGDEAELHDPISGGAVVKVQRMELQGDEIERHLESGKQVTRLALDAGGHVSFVLGEDLTVRKLKFLDGAVDSLESTERDDLAAEIDARLTLNAAELGALFDILKPALKISEVTP